MDQCHGGYYDGGHLHVAERMPAADSPHLQPVPHAGARDRQGGPGAVPA